MDVSTAVKPQTIPDFFIYQMRIFVGVEHRSKTADTMDEYDKRFMMVIIRVKDEYIL